MRKLFAVAATIGIVTAAACNDSPTEPGAVAGTYHLQTINGALLPVTVFQNADFRLDVLSSTLVLNSDLTYVFSSTLREVEGGVPATFTESEFGTWSTTSFGVVLRDSEGFSTSARIEGNSLTIEEGGLRLVFAR